MSTVREIVYKTRHLFERNRLSDDSSLSNRWIYCLLKAHRAKVLYEDRNKNRDLNKSNYQTICLDLIKTDKNECGCAPPSGCIILKSACPIPTLLDNIIKSVSTIDGSVKFESSEFEEIQYLEHARFKGEKTKDRYYLRDNGDGTHLYVVSKNNMLKTITFTGVFEDPDEGIDCCSNTVSEEDTCTSPLDREFKIDARLIPLIIDLVMRQVLPAWDSRVEDTLNNGKDDSGQNQIKNINK